MKNASRVPDIGGNSKAVTLDQKPRESKSKHAEFILSVHVYGEIHSIPSSKISNENPGFINQNLPKF